MPKRGYSPDFHVIFVLPPVVGCLLKTWLTKGGGGGAGSRAPQDPPGYAPDRQGHFMNEKQSVIFVEDCRLTIERSSNLKLFYPKNDFFRVKF